MTRHSSIDEVNSALIELEENERSGSSSTDKLNSEKHSDTEKPSSRHPSNALSANGENLVNGGEENGGIHEDIGDSDTDSGSGTLEQEGHDDDELDEENHDDGSETEDVDDDDDGGEPVSEEDDEVHVRQKVAEVDPVEAANFEQELRAVMQVRFRSLGLFTIVSDLACDIVNILLLALLRSQSQFVNKHSEKAN